MSKEPRTLIKSREVLQSLKDRNEFTKYQTFDSLLQVIWADISREAQGGKTKYLFKITNNRWGQTMQMLPQLNNPINMTLFITDFMDILKKEYIDCKIEYVETKGYEDKVIEQIIVIDWS
jgi:hypothetical protein